MNQRATKYFWSDTERYLTYRPYVYQTGNFFMISSTFMYSREFWPSWRPTPNPWPTINSKRLTLKLIFNKFERCKGNFFGQLIIVTSVWLRKLWAHDSTKGQIELFSRNLSTGIWPIVTFSEQIEQSQGLLLPVRPVVKLRSSIFRRLEIIRQPWNTVPDTPKTLSWKGCRKAV